MQMTVYNRLIQDSGCFDIRYMRLKKQERDSFVQRCNFCEIALDFLHNSQSKGRRSSEESCWSQDDRRNGRMTVN